jgi:hypothetical protein
MVVSGPNGKWFWAYFQGISVEQEVGTAMAARATTTTPERALPAGGNERSPALHENEEFSEAEKRAHIAATKPKIQEIASTLNPLFGRELLALMTGVQNPRTVTQWVRGESEPHPGTARTLRDVAYIATFMLNSGEPRETVQAWFVGMNPQLKGKSPAEVIERDRERVLKAAKAFVAYD